MECKRCHGEGVIDKNYTASCGDCCDMEVAGQVECDECYGTGEAGTECVNDTNNDGDCHLCASRGGCSKIGGPFIKCVDCGEVKQNSEMMVRQPYCRDCY
jgi:hypothetical protein